MYSILTFDRLTESFQLGRMDLVVNHTSDEVSNRLYIIDVLTPHLVLHD